MIGDTVGHYKVLAGLGSGGMGVVYRAEDARLGRSVALKFLPPHLGHDATALERFRREARAASALNHPGICTIYDIGEATDGQPFLVMELLEGETVQQRLRRAGAIPVPELFDYALQLADALVTAHAKGIVHRDLKPANIFLTTSGQAKILDFGLAKFAAAAVEAVDPEMPTVGAPMAVNDLSVPGRAMGTAAYMSPEQALGKDLDARSDIFSLGVVLYEMATGRAAFPGETSAAVFDGILHHTPTPSGQTGLDAVLRTAMEKDPALRYQSAADVRSAIRRLKRDSESGPISTSSSPASAPAAVPPAPHGARGRWAAWAAAVVVAAAAVWWLALRRAAPLMSAKDTVVLADFANTTGDAMFNGALRQGLEVELEQSPYLTIVGDQQMMETERQMGLAPGTPIVGATAEQLCVRAASRAALEGSIAQVGNEYSLTLRAVNCASGDTLASAVETASDKDHVLPALGRLAGAMRGKLGESLASMAKFNQPIEQASTPSLPALQAYSQGVNELTNGKLTSAIAFFQQALTLDPNFAMAYARRATAESDVTDAITPQIAADYTAAYRRRNNVSAKERLYISAMYQQFVPGDLEAALRQFQIWEQTYPNDWLPFANGGVSEEMLGRYPAALRDFQQAVALGNYTALTLSNLSEAEAAEGQIPAGWKTLDQALARFPDSEYLHQYGHLFAVRVGDTDREVVEQRWLASRPGSAAALRGDEQFRQLIHGQVARARDTLRAAQAAGDPLDFLLAAQAQAEAADGDAAAARADADALARLGSTESDLASRAIALALAGAQDQANAVVAQLERLFPDSTWAKYLDVPMARAILALARHQLQAAVDVLAPAAPYEASFDAQFTPSYLRGLALLDLKQPAAAAAEFRKVIAFPFQSPWLPLAQLGLARAQVAAGDQAGARASYAAVLATWKDADANLPVVQAARLEAARLH